MTQGNEPSDRPKITPQLIISQARAVGIDTAMMLRPYVFVQGAIALIYRIGHVTAVIWADGAWLAPPGPWDEQLPLILDAIEQATAAAAPGFWQRTADDAVRGYERVRRR